MHAAAMGVDYMHAHVRARTGMAWSSLRCWLILSRADSSEPGAPSPGRAAGGFASACIAWSLREEGEAVGLRERQWLGRGVEVMCCVLAEATRCVN